METYFMFGKYSAESIKDVSADRTSKAVGLIKEVGGKVKMMYALLGEYDLVLVIELPRPEIAMKLSLGLNLLTGISFTTMPAVGVDDFDRIIAKR